MPPSREELEHALDGQNMTVLHIAVVAVCAMGFAFDLAEIAFGNVLSAVFSAPPHSVSPGELSWLLASVYIGSVLGAPLFGWLADRHGRRRVMIWLMLLLGVASALAAVAPDIVSLSLARGISGLALGAYPPLMFAYLADVLPPFRRGPTIVISNALSYLGPAGLLFLVRALSSDKHLGLDGWQWGFVVGAFGSFACAGLFLLLPESPGWLVRTGRLAEAAAVLSRFSRSRPFASATAPVERRANDPGIAIEARMLKHTLVFMLLFFLVPWATITFGALSGAMLVQKGVNVRDSMLYVALSTFGPVAGTLLGGLFVDRLDRRLFLSLGAVAMAALGLGFAAASSPATLVSISLAFSFVMSLFLPILVLFTAETSPTLYRARTTAFGWGAYRLGSALVPLLLIPILQTQGAWTAFSIVAGLLVAFVIVIAIVGEHRPQAARSGGA